MSSSPNHLAFMKAGRFWGSPYPWYQSLILVEHQGFSVSFLKIFDYLHGKCMTENSDDLHVLSFGFQGVMV